MSAYVDTDEGRFQLHVHTDDGQHVTVDIHNGALEFYENVRDQLGGYFAEAQYARRMTPEDAIAAGYAKLDEALDTGYQLGDPKHPAFHDNVSRIHDERQ